MAEGINVPVKRISDRVWDRLKQWAEPLDDNLDTVLSRVLDAAEASDPEEWPQRANRGVGRSTNGESKLARDAYYEPVLQALSELGGQARVGAVLRRLEDLLGHFFQNGTLSYCSLEAHGGRKKLTGHGTT